ncbi:dCTP deaminase [Marivita sp. XM-24bin2]|jgi:dCTP deaminase|uniref:dCTP deaminase n=1 Tax=unclassified Marivita TaxID=2632480 RepID=UPI000D78DEBF|nr:dCTP deaminase [Marivita sp. XM-24bin2]MCR9109691.1 dCTP deaminase [Paracoccaceae bacterium]PWL34999.1 MAG: dCTP deaminase [Marivita sp. XM-24bin2]
MSLLTKAKLIERINSGDADQIFIEPLLSDEQVGSVSVDLRLGCDFLVSVQTRMPSINLLGEDDFSGPEMFFESARRDIGKPFLIHPSQTVLATTLEYVGLPLNIYADIISRSSYHRLGISMTSMFQPGFRGCISLEIFNHSNVPVQLITGSRLIQARFFETAHGEAYQGAGPRRKYIGNVRPTTSRAARDSDLSILQKISDQVTG